jgi:hypothetical protein
MDTAGSPQMTRRFKRGCGTMGNSPPTRFGQQSKAPTFMSWYRNLDSALGGRL